MKRHTHLMQLLLDFQPADDRERLYRERMLQLLRQTEEQGQRAFTRDQFEPGHFTASAFVLSPSSDELLLIYHAKLTRWLQPGGHVDPADANIIEAAKREVHEEVGIEHLTLHQQGIFDIDIHAIPARGSTPEHQHFDVRFLFSAPTREYRAGSDAVDAKWVTLSAATEVQSDESVMRAMRKLLRN